ncbi:linear gramicidin synthetase subunit D domain protein [Mycobacterium xenopi 4042]|uniref:Linear gramicidin synthetase subunit D domain protein n=1 Tax=Mycobacterium xenopi 4042 TaxID=1299334 RepID=X8E8M7_MYCXE|nr:linear gramicidin synthetase subunit D domain protein [Mycobacterium xenopi 4042]
MLAVMTAEPARRLSAVDVLDAGEHARLEEWGNRVVLTRRWCRCRFRSCSPLKSRAHRRRWRCLAGMCA